MSLKNWEFFQEKANKAVAEMEQFKRENAALVAHNEALARQVESMAETIAAGAEDNRKLRAAVDRAKIWFARLELQHKGTVDDALSAIERDV